MGAAPFDTVSADAAPFFMLLSAWVLPLILLLDGDEALYLAFFGNTDITTTYSLSLIHI